MATGLFDAILREGIYRRQTVARREDTIGSSRRA
jgi:hypothetical protein